MEIRVERAPVAEVVVARCNMVSDAPNGKCTLEDGRAACGSVTLVVHGDACPPDDVAGMMRGAGGIGTHALC
jgi:hypothetical protein